MSNLHDFAVRELAIIRGTNPEPDEMQDAIESDILQIVDIFAEQGHSGMSAPYVLKILEKVLAFEPVTPLTGEDSEWNDMSDHGDSKNTIYQNNRCFRVFKEVAPDGTEYVYDSGRYIFRDEEGFTYISRESRGTVIFPYTPKRELVLRKKESEYEHEEPNHEGSNLDEMLRNDEWDDND